jgi:hypothetical protein
MAIEDPGAATFWQSVTSSAAVAVAGAFGAALRMLGPGKERVSLAEALWSVAGGGAVAYFLAPYVNDMLPEFARRESSLGAISFMLGLGGLTLVQKVVELAPDWARSRLGVPPHKQNDEDKGT